MMTLKRLALLKRTIVNNGLYVVDAGKDGGRLFAVIRAENGKTMRVTIGGKEGDLHGDLNQTAIIKRFARNNNTATLPGIPEPTDSLTTEENDMPRKKLHVIDSSTPEALAKATETELVLDLTPELENAAALDPEPRKAGRPSKSKGMKINRITQAQFYLLVEFVKPLDTLRFEDHGALAKHAAEALKMPVSASSIAEALQILGKHTLYQHQRIEARNKSKPVKAGDAVAVLARSLVTLFEHLGEAVPEDLRRIAK